MNLNVPVYTNPFIRGIEFVFGILLYKAFALRPAPDPGKKTKIGPLLLTLLAYLLVIIVGENYVPYQYSAFFIAVPFITVMIYALLKMHWYPGEKAVRFCTLLGGLSYVLYCFHWPLMEMIQYFNLVPHSLPYPMHVLLLLTLLILVSYVVYRFIETPIRRALYRRVQN